MSEQRAPAVSHYQYRHSCPQRKAASPTTIEQPSLARRPQKVKMTHMGYHLVRYSLLGQIGRFVSADATCYPRRSRVIVRSPRGLEIGEVLAEPGSADIVSDADGQILRRMTIEDELLEVRLEKHRHSAFEACSALLREHQVPAALVDVEHLFDGQGLFFYFLGDVPPEAAHLTQQLAETYATTVEFRKFTETLAEGCGPGCGTQAAIPQGGCESCATCAIASACGMQKN